MSTTVKVPRGTRGSLNAKATAGTIVAGQVYLITDENRLAVGLTTTTYQDFVKSSEASTTLLIPATDYGGSATSVVLALASGYREYQLDIWDFRPAADETDGVVAAFSFDGGSTYPSASYVFAAAFTQQPTASAPTSSQYGVGSSAPYSGFYVMDECSGTAGHPGKSVVEISVSENSGTREALKPQFMTRSTTTAPSGAVVVTQLGGYCTTAGRPTHLRIKCSGGGAIASMRASLTGKN